MVFNYRIESNEVGLNPALHRLLGRGLGGDVVIGVLLKQNNWDTVAPQCRFRIRVRMDESCYCWVSLNTGISYSRGRLPRHGEQAPGQRRVTHVAVRTYNVQGFRCPRADL